LALAGLWGCSGQNGGAAAEVALPTTAPLPHRPAGPLRDVDPAVRFAASFNEMAVLEVTRPEPTRIVYRLMTARDEPATLTLGLPDPIGDDPLGPGEMEMEARIGRFGDEQRERAFLRDLRERMEQLGEAGGVAPVDGG